MIMEIGITAGEIWHYLDEHGEVFLPDLIKSIERKRELVLMSLGWLAREGHVMVVAQGGEYKVWLRK